jgi:PKD repeat protein
MKKIYQLVFFVCFMPQFIKAQWYCGTDEMALELLNQHPEFISSWKNQWFLQEAHIQSFQPTSRGGNPYIIPVVVHVIHHDGNENISDEQIRNGIEILTRNYRKQNPDTSEIIPIFKPIAADMEIEFQLAKLDPNGNCTNGINRIRSPLTTVGDHQVKSLIHWPRDKYVNIYIVRNAAGLAGHALMPFQADTIPQWDGIVLAGDYMGNIGTSDNTRSVVLSHELGHFLNLFHVWGGNNVPGFYYLPVGLASNCNEDDGVYDTPNTIGWQNCNLNGTSCDPNIIDNVQNFMDYAYCARMFTEGQKQRVHAALNSPIAQRNNLWTSQNLLETGITANIGLCKADFKINRHLACTGELVQYTDVSFHGVNSWHWNFGDQQTSIIQNPQHAYVNPGRYDVSLSVSDGINNLSKSKHNALVILPDTGQSLPFYEDFEYRDSIWQTGLHPFSEHDINWTLFQGAGSNGNQCAVLLCNDDTLSYQYSMYTPALDLRNVQQPVFSFKYAFARNNSTNKDNLKVKISKDCGQYWLTRLSITDTLATAPDTLISFIPNDNEWKQVKIKNIPPSFFTENVVFKIEFTSSGGNNFYVDEINVYDEATIGLEEYSASNTWHVFPNPTNDYVSITSENMIEEWKIITISGKELMSGANNNHNIQISLHHIPSGIYLIGIHTENGYSWKKIIRK